MALRSTNQNKKKARKRDTLEKGLNMCSVVVVLVSYFNITEQKTQHRPNLADGVESSE